MRLMLASQDLSNEPPFMDLILPSFTIRYTCSPIEGLEPARITTEATQIRCSDLAVC